MPLPDSTPVILGAGQVTERIAAPDYQARSPQQLAADAASLALADAGNADTLRNAVDAIAFVRTFADSVPESLKVLFAPFGDSCNQPRSVAQRVGCNPEHAILSKACGDEPQRLVAEFCQRISTGELRAGVICGAEAIASLRALQRGTEPQPDWSEAPEGSLEDRGQGIELLFDGELARHGAMAPVDIYPLFENARRGRLAADRDDYRATMGHLFARFAEVAANNPLSMSQKALSAAEIATESERNRLIAEPYLKAMVARDWVNQGAAVVITSLGLARSLGVASQAVFLHGHAHAVELPTLERPDLDHAPAMTWAYQQALAAAETDLAAINAFDLYSCFPIAVFAALEALSMTAEDPRPLTLTGGLPFFGGPGNNYSLHAIAEAVGQCRADGQCKVLVGANGGYLSKHAVGIYSSTPRAPTFAAERAQGEAGRVATVKQASGEARIETYTIKPGKGGNTEVIAVCRLNSSNERFVANVHPEDATTLRTLLDKDPLGLAVTAQPTEERNWIKAASS